MKEKIHVFNTPEETAREVARLIVQNINRQADRQQYFNMALSGGNTPALLFHILASEFTGQVQWNALRIFWVDERCVPPSDKDSNYGMTYENLLKKEFVPAANIFRMKGEYDPMAETLRYQSLLASELPLNDGIPVFDLVLLGMGDDGHMASIFPDNMSLLNSVETVAVVQHPQSGQGRITLTGSVIRAAKQRIFLITGKSKSDILRNIIHKEPVAELYPASHLISLPDTEVFADKKACSFL